MLNRILTTGALAALALTLTTADLAEASGRGNFGGRGGHRVAGASDKAHGKRISEALGLSNEQKAQLQKLRTQGREEMQALRSQEDVTREQVQALRESHREAFLAVLTDEQRATAEQVRAERETIKAAGKGRRGGRRQQRLHLQEALGLNEDQQSQLQTLREEARTAVQALRKDESATRDQFRALRESHREAFLAVLTDEQRATAEQVRAERETIKAAGKGRRGGRRQQRLHLQEALGLNEDQQSQLQTLREEARTAVQALREDESATRDQFRALRESRRRDFLEILTEEQQATMESLRAKRLHHRGRFGPADGTKGAEGEGLPLLEATDGASKAATSVQSITWGQIKAEIPGAR
ncbi:MAG: hypothetical protein VX733_13460 [Candidatus Latescibacterota bacterium]|nr:hypothetical protein [Candidatus Latescibacterota bacterium]